MITDNLFLAKRKVFSPLSPHSNYRWSKRLKTKSSLVMGRNLILSIYFWKKSRIMLHCVCFKRIKFLLFDSETTTNISQHLVSWLFTFFVYNQLFCLRLRTFLPFCLTIFSLFFYSQKKFDRFLRRTSGLTCSPKNHVLW